jgi:hypothetical protein
MRLIVLLIKGFVVEAGGRLPAAAFLAASDISHSATTSSMHFLAKIMLRAIGSKSCTSRLQPLATFSLVQELRNGPRYLCLKVNGSYRCYAMLTT